MEKSSVRDKARKFHDKIRRDRLNEIFKQKRSKLMESFQQISKSKELFNQRLKDQISKENEELIESEFSLQQMYDLWNEIKNCQNDKQRMNIFQTQNLQESLDLDFFSKKMSKICQMICQLVKQINDYNQFQHAILQSAINAHTESERFNIPNEKFQIIQKKLQLLLEISQVAQYKLSQYNANDSWIINDLNFKSKGDRIYFQLIIWVNILVEISSLKYPSQRQNKFVKRFKELAISHQILKFSQTMLQMSIKRSYLTSRSLVIKLSKLIYNQLSNKLKQTNPQQLLTIQQSINKVVEMAISLYYIIGNVMSDFQPTKIQKALKYQQKMNNNFLKTADFNDETYFYLNLVDQLGQCRFNLQSFYQHLLQLEVFRNLVFERCINFDQHNHFAYLNENDQQVHNNHNKIIVNKTSTYRHYLSLVQLQVWQSRLLLIGGWLEQDLNSQYSNNKFAIQQKQKQKLTIIHLIERVAISQIIESNELIQKMNITSKQSIKKVTQNMSQSLLVLQLAIRQSHILSQKHPQQYLSSQRLQIQQHLKQRLYFSSFEHKQIYDILKEIKKMTKRIYAENVIQAQQELNLIDELECMLINMFQTLIQCDYGVVYDLNQHLSEFILQCSQAKTPCSQVIILPLLVMNHFNKNFKQSLKHTSYLQLVHSIYTNFINSQHEFAPVHMFKNQRMIEQEDDMTYNNKFCPQYLKKKYLLNPSLILNYFVQNLPHKKQEHYYLSYIKMLKQCYSFYQHSKTSHIQSNLITMSSRKQMMKNQHSPYFYQKFPSLLTEDFIHKFLYFIVDRLSQFEQTSSVHLQALQFITLVLNTLTNDKEDQSVETYFKHMIENNAHGIREHLQNMTLWESEELNQTVTQIFQILEIQ